MDTRNLGFIMNATGGELRNASPQKNVKGICTDSRKVSSGDLFVALVGEHFDAHDFLTTALGQKAAASLVEADRVGNRLLGLPQIRVTNSRKALADLSSAYRRGFDLPIIALTGSNGKTSTKRFLHSVLETRFRVCSSPASFNNDIGVPLSLLQLGEATGVAVFEIGTNHPGEIKPLTEMVKPSIGVLTSIGRSHLEFFGSVESVAYEKGFLAEAIPPDGLFFVNGEIPFLEKILSRVKASIVKVGFGKENDWILHRWKMGYKGMSFSITNPRLGLTGDYHCPLWGRHHLVNLGLAIAVGFALGLNETEITKGISKARPEPMRFEPRRISGVTILDDTYNANVDSTLAALETLAQFPATRRIAVLGEMGELGEFHQSAHSEVGAAAAKFEHILAVGKGARTIADASRKSGARSVIAISELSEAQKHLERFLRKGDVILVKASRAAGLDRLTKGLIPFLQSFDKMRLSSKRSKQSKRSKRFKQFKQSEQSERKVDSSECISIDCHFEEEPCWTMPLEIASSQR